MILEMRAYCILIENMSSGIHCLGSNPGSVISCVALGKLISLCHFRLCYMGIIMVDEENQ